jgi:hypothetical protein
MAFFASPTRCTPRPHLAQCSCLVSLSQHASRRPEPGGIHLVASFSPLSNWRRFASAGDVSSTGTASRDY